MFSIGKVNPKAKFSFKLVPETGIRIILCGVVKGNADIIQISEHEGGTRESLISSIKHRNFGSRMMIMKNS